MRYNIDEIYSRTTGLEVAEALGLDISDDCRYILCPNPEHHDTNFGSCVLQDYACYCFACSKSTSLIDMVMQTKGWKDKQGFAKSVEWLARLTKVCGSSNEAAIEDEMPPFTKEELNLVGLHHLVNPKSFINISDTKPDKKTERDGNGEYLIKERNVSFSMTEMFRNDPLCYYSIIQGKIVEKLKLISSTLKSWKMFSEYIPSYYEESIKKSINQQRVTLLKMEKKCDDYFEHEISA